MVKRVRAVASGVFLAAAFSCGAQADIIFSATPSGTGDNVVFNEQPANQSGTTVFGNINNPADTLVTLTSNETLVTPAGGQALVQATDNTLSLLQISLAAAGTGFDSFVADLNSPNGTTGTATITATNQFNQTETFSLALGSGSNFFTLTTDALQFLTSVQISSTVGLLDVRQIRLGEVQAVPGPIAGAGIPGLLAACFGLIGLARRRRRRLLGL